MIAPEIESDIEAQEATMGFAVFEKGSAPVSTVPAVTIQKRGLFSLNDASYKLLGEPETIQFLWDADEKLIALKPSARDDLNGYPARRQSSTKGHGPVLVAGSMFCKFIGLDTTHAKRWTPRKQDELLIIDLKEPGALVISNRERGAKARADVPDDPRTPEREA